MPSLSSSTSISSVMPSPSVSGIFSASRKSTSSARGIPPVASPSASGRANAPVARLSLTLNPSLASVPPCVSNTSNRPSPSASVAASESPVAKAIKPASTASLPPSSSESVSMKSGVSSSSESTGLIRASADVAAAESASRSVRLSKLSSRPSILTSVIPASIPLGAIKPFVVCASILSVIPSLSESISRWSEIPSPSLSISEMIGTTVKELA